MKKILFILGLILVLGSCTPVRYVNFHSRHNFYERHRHNTYTSPTWIPGRGVTLETHIIVPQKKFGRKLPHRAPRGKY